MRWFDEGRVAHATGVALCLSLLIPGAGAQSLSLDAAVAAALAHHPLLRVAALERQAAGGATEQAQAWQNPELSTVVEDSRSATRTTTVQLTQPVELGGKRAARIQAAQAAQVQADLDVSAMRAQVTAQAMAAFHALAIAQEKVRLSDELGRLATQARETVTKRVQAGKVSPVEEVKAQVAQAQALSVLMAAQGEQRAAWSQLRQALGDEASRFDRVELGSLPQVQRWQPLVPLLEASAVVLRAQQEVVRRQALAELETARRTPDLALTLGTKRDAQMGRNQAVAGVSLVLPLFDRNQGAILEASRREDKARIELDATRASVRSQAEQALAQLQAAVAQARLLQGSVLPAARQAFATTTRGYELGKFGYLDVLDAQRTLFDAETQALNVAAQAHQADARLVALLGEPAPKKD